MKTYYFSLANEIEANNGWSSAPQKSIECKDWVTFVSFCKNICKSFNTVVRGCESLGYNNQGHYFNA